MFEICSGYQEISTEENTIFKCPGQKKEPLAACGADKLRATVKAQRLECKQLDQLQTEIKKDGVGVSEGLEKDILTIMGGQNLEATPHMKFFW